MEDGDALSFLSREECALAQGKKLWAAPLQQGGKRRSRPLPTKAIHEVGNERGSHPFGPRRFGEGRIFLSIDRLTVARAQSPLCLPMSGALCAVA